MEGWRKYLTPRERDDRYEALLAGGAKTRLLESVIDLELPALLALEGPLSATAIANRLALFPHRARKWLHLLSLIGLVEKIPATSKGASATELYTLSPLSRGIFGDDGRGGDFYRDKVHYWRLVAELDFIAVLRGMPLPEAVRWPPQTMEAAQHLEWWMRITAEGAIQAVEKAVDWDKVEKMLDAAGGDATMACAFAKKHPNLKITVFNLPNSAYMARNNIAQAHLSDRIEVVTHDFLSDIPFPAGFELVLWSRVLCDWAPEVARDVLQKTHEALVPGGQVVICEPLLEGNEDFVTAWEFRYIFSDDFGVGCYKSRAAYEQMLAEIGFEVKAFFDRDDENIYSVIIAERV